MFEKNAEEFILLDVNEESLRVLKPPNPKSYPI